MAGRKCFFKANFVEISRGLSRINWQIPIGREDSVETMVRTFYTEMARIIDQNVPSVSVIRTGRGGKRDPKWMTVEIKRNMSDRKKAWRLQNLFNG